MFKVTLYMMKSLVEILISQESDVVNVNGDVNLGKTLEHLVLVLQSQQMVMLNSLVS